MKKIVKGLCVLAASVLVGGSALVGCGPTEKPPVEVEKVKVTGVTIEKEAYEVGCDFTVEIKAGVLPLNVDEKGITYTSSDVNIATVDDKGVVTGVNPGEATITATSVDGGYKATTKVLVKGFHTSSKVFTNVNAMENNAYNNGTDYTVDTSNEDYFDVTFNRKTMGEWASLVLYYDTSVAATKVEITAELLEGNLPSYLMEFGGELNFKNFYRVPLVKNKKSTISINVTDTNFKTGEAGAGGWGSIFLELNNPQDDTDKFKGTDSNVKLRFHKVSFEAGTAQKPADVTNFKYDEENGYLKFDKDMAAANYELELYKKEGEEFVKQELDVRNTRFNAIEHIPGMKMQFIPKAEQDFSKVPGEYKARIRTGNSAGKSEWVETLFTVKGQAESGYVSEGFSEKGKISLNQWSTNKTFAAELKDDGYHLSRKRSADNEEDWSSFVLSFNKDAGYKKLEASFNVIKGTMTKVGFEFCDFDGEDGKAQIFEEFQNGTYNKSIDITADLSKRAGQFLIIPNRVSGTAGDVEIVLTKLNLK